MWRPIRGLESKSRVIEVSQRQEQRAEETNMRSDMCINVVTVHTKALLMMTHAQFGEVREFLDADDGVIQ